MYDKAENNPLQVNGHRYVLSRFEIEIKFDIVSSAWGSIYNINTQAVRPLNLQTNSFWSVLLERTTEW